jgi:acyl carrier protein
MIPSFFVHLKQLPKLPNGKLDRRALPAPDDNRPALATTFVAPRTPLEAQLAQIWCEVLGLARVGVKDPFIDLGGNSLQAAQIVARASRAAGIDIPLSALFDVPTIEGLAQLITLRLADKVQTQDLDQWLAEIEATDAPTAHA